VPIARRRRLRAQRKAARPHEGARDGVLHLGQAIGILRHQQERNSRIA